MSHFIIELSYYVYTCQTYRNKHTESKKKNNVQNSLATSHALNLTIEMFYISSILIKNADCLFSIE